MPDALTGHLRAALRVWQRMRILPTRYALERGRER